MEIRHVRYFVTVVQEGQITTAAQKLNMAQPPLSQQIRRLEKELGTQLLVRVGKKFLPTEAGELLYERGIELLKEFDDVVDIVKDTGEGLRGTLQIGCVKSCLHHLPATIRSFHEQWPNVHIQILSGDPFQLAASIHDREIDVALVRSPHPQDQLHFTSLDEEEPFYFITAKHQWIATNRQTVTMKEIAGLPLFALHRVKGIGIYELVHEAFKHHGLTPNYICESPDATTLLTLVESGLGGIMLPEAVLSTFSKENFSIYRITDCHVTTTTALITPKDRHISRAAQHFKDLLVQ